MRGHDDIGRHDRGLGRTQCRFGSGNALRGLLYGLRRGGGGLERAATGTACDAARRYAAAIAVLAVASALT
jgi:hypothetical protein